MITGVGGGAEGLRSGSSRATHRTGGNVRALIKEALTDVHKQQPQAHPKIRTASPSAFHQHKQECVYIYMIKLLRL